MLSNYFYNATIKRVVSVFGTIFNNIKIARFDSGVTTNTLHVPISYGPRSKFLARIREEGNFDDPGVAIKLPRLSFEMTSIDYDSSSKLNKLNKVLTGSGTNQKTSTFQSVPYTIGMQLNIYAKNQDDALQIVEQILPTFSPEYTVTIKGIDGPDSKTDVPFILNGVSFQDEYEGDFGNNRRIIIYTLDFTIRIKFAPGNGLSRVIKRVTAKVGDAELKRTPEEDLDPGNSPNAQLFSQVFARQDSPNDSPRSFTTFVNPSDTYSLVFNEPAPAFAAGRVIIGKTSLVGGIIRSIDGVNATADNLEGLFTAGEVIASQDSPDITGTLNSITLS